MPVSIRVKIDTQTASKITNEKRKRNAGASARFRQRCKDKEQAASQEIANLKRKIYELTQELNLCKNERDYLRDVCENNGNLALSKTREASKSPVQ